MQIHTGFLHYAHCFSRHSFDDFAWPFGVTFTIPSFSTVSSDNFTFLVKLDSVFFGFRIRGVTDQRHALINLDDRGIEGGGSPDIEIEYLRTRLVSDKQEIFESLCNQQRMFVSLSFKEGICRDCCG